MAGESDPERLAAALIAGDRRALARAITLVESTRADHRDAAEKLLTAILPRTGGATRLGITGSPGVGKSTFIEAFGKLLIARGHRVAELAGDLRAFIRPSPAGKSLGGVARRTRDAMLLAEVAGFDIVIVETVGVGQSETAVADLVDLFMLLIAPGGGDDLQGIKKGIVELADLLIVNKADGDLAPAARRAVADYRHALRMLRPPAEADGPGAEVLAVSALEGKAIDKVWDTVEARIAAARKSGALTRRREAQARAALESEIGDGLMDRFRADQSVARLLRTLETRVAARKLTPSAAARQALDAFAKN